MDNDNQVEIEPQVIEVKNFHQKYLFLGLVALLLITITLFIVFKSITAGDNNPKPPQTTQTQDQSLKLDATETGQYSFAATKTGVHILGTSNNVLQTIELADIDINAPKSNFVGVYGSAQSMETMRDTTPSILNNFDLNFDGVNDLGILVDTGPIEPGYVFYISNGSDDTTEPFRPAKLAYHISTGPFVVYEPSLVEDGTVLRGKFTVTNPRQVDYSYYIYDSKTGMFFDTEIDSEETSVILEQYDFIYKNQPGTVIHKCHPNVKDVFTKPARYVEKFPEDKGYCTKGGTLELTIDDESILIEEYEISKQTDHKKIEALSFTSGEFGARDGSYTHSTSSENSNHKLMISFYHQDCRWDGAGGVCFWGESISHIVNLPYPANTSAKLEVTTISPPLFIFQGYKGLKWNSNGTAFVVRDAANDPVPSFRVYKLGESEPLFEYIVDYPNDDQELLNQVWGDEMFEWRGTKIQILDTVFDLQTGEESPSWLNIFAIEQYNPITINGTEYLPDETSGPTYNSNRYSYDQNKFVTKDQTFTTDEGTFEIYPALGNNFGYHYLRLGDEVFGMRFTGLGAVGLVSFEKMNYSQFEDIGNGYATDGEYIYYVSSPEPLIAYSGEDYQFLELEAVSEPVLIAGNSVAHRGRILDGLDYSTLHIGNADNKPEGYYLSDADNTVYMQSVQCHTGSHYSESSLDQINNWLPGC